MPLKQPRRDNPLMRRYFDEINLSGKQLARECGVSHSQMYMARKRNVGADNAEKISRRMAMKLGLSYEDRLRLKAEIMGHPENLVRAYFGSGADAARKLGVSIETGDDLVHPEKTVAHSTGTRALRYLEETRASEVVVEAVRKKMRPRYSPPGRVTNTQRGLEARNRRAQSLFLFKLFKPKTAEALERAGLQKQEIRRRAGASREQFRKALYVRCGRKTAGRVAEVLKEELGLSEEEREAISLELQSAPPATFEEASKEFSEDSS
jgi:hypothetical protein